MDAMLVVDMQVGLLNGEPKHDLRGVIERISSPPKSANNPARSSSCSIAAARETILNRTRPAGRFFPNWFETPPTLWSGRI
jgi:nicotinamidase-related amidase